MNDAEYHVSDKSKCKNVDTTAVNDALKEHVGPNKEINEAITP